MKKIILIAIFVASLFAAGKNLPDAKIISTTDCHGINLKINFKTDSDVIAPESYAKIQDFANYMNANSDKHAELAGYTDSRGSDLYNLELSQRRALSVYNKLIEDGVDSNRLSHAGYGEANPVASNETKKGQLANRRIEAKLY